MAVNRTRADVTPELLRVLLKYDPETGALTWRKRDVDLFRGMKQSAEHGAKAWNTRYAGKPAFTAVNGQGYHHGSIFKFTFLAHVVGWAIYYGRWPENELDHEHGGRRNNAISILRDVDHQTNMKNCRLSKANTSGVTGVSWRKKDAAWWATIFVNGKHRSIGMFAHIGDAVEARHKAEIEAGFHRNHGSSRFREP